MKLRFPEFRDTIEAGANPLTDPRVRMAVDGRDSLIYAPFERPQRRRLAMSE